MNGDSRVMSDAERELVEAIMSETGGNVGIAKLRVARERLDQEIPGWELEAKSAYMFYRSACDVWYKWTDRLDRGGVHRRYDRSDLVDGWEKEWIASKK